MLGSSRTRRQVPLWTSAVLLLVLVGVQSARISGVYEPETRQESSTNEDYADFLARRRQILQLFQQRPELVEQWERAQLWSALDGDEVYVPFNCPTLDPSPTTPTTAHAVRPSDIKVVGALGDSITAANGVRATTPIEVAITNRGESWSIGGERSLENYILTIPNILRKYNPNVIGASDCRRPVASQISGLNVAVPGDTNRGMEAQAVEVMTQMLENPAIDYWNDWKLITIFIGGNDLCQICLNNVSFSPEGYYQGIKAALDKFYVHLPRGIINLQPMFDVSVVKDLIHPETEELCRTLHKIECPCNDYPEWQKAAQMEYFDRMVELTDGRYDQRSDFTVVLQPHLRDITPWKFPNGTYDMSFVAPDCFHPGHKAHQMFAFMLWNMMFTPVGEKTTNYTIGYDEVLEYKCPTEANPYIYTNLNSNLKV